VEVIICNSEEDVAVLVATHICELVRSKPSAVLGLATGKSPVRTYYEIIRKAGSGGVNFATVRVFMLDEYLGIRSDHPSRFFNVLSEFTKDVGITEDNVFKLPNSWPAGDDPDRELHRQCQEYEDVIKNNGGIDLQLLGISQHGHIGFNEPMSSLSSRTRVKTLTEHTRKANADSFAEVAIVGENLDWPRFEVTDGFDKVPMHVVTQGVGTILESRHAILIATGDAKAAIVAKAVEGPLTSFVPASALQMHPHATVVLDEAAARDLMMVDYYREVQQNKRYIQHPIT
jgi:glucosamine-6-phosphate deaminase